MSGSTIEEHLKDIARICSGKQKEYWQWVAKNGKAFTEEDRDMDGEEKIIADPTFHTKKQACYYNSQMLVVGYDCLANLKYFEGFFLGESIPLPFEHGFVVQEERVIDISARKWNIETTEWFGVHIPTDFVRKQLVDNRVACALLSMWYREKIIGGN